MAVIYEKKPYLQLLSSSPHISYSLLARLGGRLASPSSSISVESLDPCSFLLRRRTDSLRRTDVDRLSHASSLAGLIGMALERVTPLKKGGAGSSSSRTKTSAIKKSNKATVTCQFFSPSVTFHEFLFPYDCEILTSLCDIPYLVAFVNPLPCSLH